MTTKTNWRKDYLWDYKSEELAKTAGGQVKILERMINFGPGKKKNSAGTGKKALEEVKTYPSRFSFATIIDMGQISLLNQKQKSILAGLAKSEYLRENFYFTGGTALSQFYLQHRSSDDFDFFSLKKIDQKIIFGLISDLSQKRKFKFEARLVEVVFRFQLIFSDQQEIKLDFGYFPYQQLKRPKPWQGLKVDSLQDIAVNKLISISQRSEIKDFVDLYFIFKEHFGFWDLFRGAEKKFKSLILDPFLISQDFLKVEDFDFLPKMIKPLSLKELKTYFRQIAERIGRQGIE